MGSILVTGVFFRGPVEADIFGGRGRGAIESGRTRTLVPDDPSRERPMNDPHPPAERWRDYLAGRIGGADADALDAHLQSCEACAAGLAALGPDGSAFVDRLRSAAGSTGAYDAGAAGTPNPPRLAVTV